MNDGQCIQGGEGEGASPFIHFHCKCVHPNKGILCDVSCDMDSKYMILVCLYFLGDFGCSVINSINKLCFFINA